MDVRCFLNERGGCWSLQHESRWEHKTVNEKDLRSTSARFEKPSLVIGGILGTNPAGLLDEAYSGPIDFSMPQLQVSIKRG